MFIGSLFFPSNFQDTDIGVVMSLLLRGLKGIRGRGEGGAHNPFQSDRPRKTHPVSFNLKECRFFCSFFLFRLVALISYHDMKPSTVHNCPTTSFYLIHYFEPTNGLHEKGRRGKNPKQQWPSPGISRSSVR